MTNDGVTEPRFAGVLSRLVLGQPRESPSSWLSGGIVAAGIVLGALAFALYHSNHGAVGNDARPALVAPTASPDRPRISGGSGRDLALTEVAVGRPTTSLKVGRVRFESGPLGFLRVGFFQTAVLEDARLTVNLPTRSTDVSSADLSSAIRAVESALVAPLGQQEMMRIGPIGGFTGVNASPLRVQVTRDGREILVLGSDRAAVDVRGRQLDLEGQVRLSVEGGARVLESQALHVLLETQEIWTDGDVHLRTPQGRVQVHGFRSDIFLRTGAFQLFSSREGALGHEQRADRAGKESRP